MHSSRMRTGRSLTVCRSLLPGGCLLPGWRCLIPGGCLLLGGVCSGGGVCSQGCLLPGGGSASGGVGGRSAPGRGVCPWGGGIPTCTEADPPVNRMTDRCKNITLATTLLWLVKMPSLFSVLSFVHCLEFQKFLIFYSEMKYPLVCLLIDKYLLKPVNSFSYIKGITTCTF